MGIHLLALRALGVGVLAAFVAAASATAAPIDIVARLEPGQTGPFYSWSLRISTAPGTFVGSLTLLTRGFDSFAFNPANPGIALRDSGFINDDPISDGRAILLISAPSTSALAPAGAFDVLLGTFLSPYDSRAQVSLEDCELVCGSTVTMAPTPFGPSFPRDAFTLRVVPEPAAGLLVLTAALALRTARRRGV